MTEEELRQQIEEIDPEGRIPQDKIEELVLLVRQDRIEEVAQSVSGTLEEQLANETDWRKRSILAAKIISRNLE